MVLGSALVLVAKPKHDLSVFVAPRRAIDFVSAIVGTGRELFHGAVVAELEKFLRPARERNVSAGITEHRSALAVVAVDVHPARRNERTSCRVVYHKLRLGPLSVARIRATCCVVNMNIASSSV